MRRSTLVLCTFLGAGTLLLHPSPSGAAEEEPQWEESDDLPAIQNRKFKLQHELDVGMGILPADAFYKGFSVTGAYLWHITDLWAAEGRFHYLKPMLVKSKLRDKLEKNFGEPPSKFAEIHMYGEAGVLFKPIYGKLSFLNKTLAYGEVYLAMSAVVAKMVGGKATESEPQGKGTRIAVGGAPGFGIRGFLNEYLSLRFDFRYMLLYSQGEMHYPLALTLSLGITTRSDL